MDRRRLNADTRTRHDVAGAVDGELAVDGAADGEAAQVVVVHRPLQGIGALERGAGHEPRQAIGRAISERHLPNQLAVDHPAHRCGAGVEQRRLGGHQDLGRHAGGLQREVDLQPVADPDLDRLADHVREAVQFHGDAIDARDQQRRLNWPPSPVTTVLVALVPVLTMVTVTPGRTPPEESTTRPLMVPRIPGPRGRRAAWSTARQNEAHGIAADRRRCSELNCA